MIEIDSIPWEFFHELSNDVLHSIFFTGIPRFRVLDGNSLTDVSKNVTIELHFSILFLWYIIFSYSLKFHRFPQVNRLILYHTLYFWKPKSKPRF